ncbi:MAG: hypothetical protein PHP46_06185 [Candidatus Omnitrophica bacterium]|nr:hypothetical protein [Candidatus Omnitrophota bacterium]
MDNSVLLAKFLGPFIIVIGLGLFLNPKKFRKVIKEFISSASLVYVSGLMTFVMGLAIVIFNNIWAMDWRLIITVFGWLTLIKGAWFIIMPETLTKMSGFFLKHAERIFIPWAIMLALGLFLCVKGYF